LAPPIATSYSNVTFRDIAHISLGGSQVRLTLSNEFGPGPLDIGGAHIGLSGGGGTIIAGSDRTVTFGSKEAVRIPAGAVAVSDPMSLDLPAFSDLAVSIYIPANETADHLSYHALASSTNYIADGNVLASISLDGAKPVASWMILKGIEVESKPGASAVVAFGDSITDGDHSTPNKNTRWPNFLAERLHANQKTANISVLDAGISGNRLFSLGNPLVGQDALARFDRDVLAQSGVKYLIVLEGINDIGRAGKPLKPDDSTDEASLIWALEQMAIRAHNHGLKVFVATLGSYTGFSYYYSSHGEEMRQAVNAFIRQSNEFDAVIDFDKVLRDPQKPDRLNAAYDSGDHLHPNDAGYQAMADAIDLALFR
jgi:lysophospholipase L1-like esterase